MRLEHRRHSRQAPTLEKYRRDVEFQIEKGELGRELGALEAVDHLHRNRGGGPRPVDEEDLLLGPDPPDPGLEHARCGHHLQRLDVFQHATDERPLRLGGGELVDVLLPYVGLVRSLVPNGFAHGDARDRCDLLAGGRRRPRFS